MIFLCVIVFLGLPKTNGKYANLRETPKMRAVQGAASTLTGAAT